MNVLIAEGQKHDHELYQRPRKLLTSCTIELNEDTDYLITDPIVLDFFLRCLYAPSRASMRSFQVVADARYQPNLAYSAKLVHFKLTRPDLLVLGQEWNTEFEEAKKQITETEQIPNDVLHHFSSSMVTWPNTEIDDDEIVAIGCSYTAGSGLGRPELESYPNILREKLQRPVKNLGVPGSSIEYAGKVLRSLPLRKSNIVVWQLTGLLRWIEYDSKPYQETFSKHPIGITVHRVAPHFQSDKLTKEEMIRGKASLKILTATREHLKGIGCRFVLIGADPFSMDLPWPEFVRVNTIDVGNDHVMLNGQDLFDHPGPLTHQAYADAVISKLGIL